MNDDTQPTAAAHDADTLEVVVKDQAENKAFTVTGNIHDIFEENTLREFSALEEFYINVAEIKTHQDEAKARLKTKEREQARAKQKQHAARAEAGRFPYVPFVSPLSPNFPFVPIETKLNMAGHQMHNIVTLIDHYFHRTPLAAREVEGANSELRLRALKAGGNTATAGTTEPEKKRRYKTLVMAKKKQLEHASSILKRGAANALAIIQRGSVFTSEVRDLSYYWRVKTKPAADPALPSSVLVSYGLAQMGTATETTLTKGEDGHVMVPELAERFPALWASIAGKKHEDVDKDKDKEGARAKRRVVEPSNLDHGGSDEDSDSGDESRDDQDREQAALNRKRRKLLARAETQAALLAKRPNQDGMPNRGDTLGNENKEIESRLQSHSSRLQRLLHSVQDMLLPRHLFAQIANEAIGASTGSESLGSSSTASVGAAPGSIHGASAFTGSLGPPSSEDMGLYNANRQSTALAPESPGGTLLPYTVRVVDNLVSVEPKREGTRGEASRGLSIVFTKGSLGGLRVLDSQIDSTHSRALELFLQTQVLRGRWRELSRGERPSLLELVALADNNPGDTAPDIAQYWKQCVKQATNDNIEEKLDSEDAGGQSGGVLKHFLTIVHHRMFNQEIDKVVQRAIKKTKRPESVRVWWNYALRGLTVHSFRIYVYDRFTAEVRVEGTSLSVSGTGHPPMSGAALTLDGGRFHRAPAVFYHPRLSISDFALVLEDIITTHVSKSPR